MPEIKPDQKTERALKILPRWGWAVLGAAVVVGLVLFLGRQTSQAPAEKAIQDGAAAIVEADDLSGCDSLDKNVDGVDYRTVCRNNIFLSRAERNLDFGACQSLDGVLLSIADCEDTVMALLIEREKDPAVCANAPERLKPSCPSMYIRLTAAAERNPRLCETPSFSEEDIVACQYEVLVRVLLQGEQANCESFSRVAPARECARYEAKQCGELTVPLLAERCRTENPSPVK
ncbi:MAG: hypothetical protein Q8R13_00785 [bacterium]|nr:hypothetical protein [bacterium]MDZ4296126.1 hypothetical protein [Patescibacteria group bacterium]